MKRTICLMLVFLFLASLSACYYSESGDILEPVEFFYPRKPDYFVYGADDGVLAAEVREGSGHIGDLYYLLSMYLRGPQDETLRSPFPEGCKLKDVRFEEDMLRIVLSAEFTTLENLDLTIACASLAKTSLSLSGAQRMHIYAVSDKKTLSITMDQDTLLLTDYSAFDVQAPTE